MISDLALFIFLLLYNVVTFKLNALLDLSWQATTKSLSSLRTKSVLQVLGESTRTLSVRMIRGDEGMGDIPGVQGGSGESEEFGAIRTQLTQELRLRV